MQACPLDPKPSTDGKSAKFVEKLVLFMADLFIYF